MSYKLVIIISKSISELAAISAAKLIYNQAKYELDVKFESITFISNAAIIISELTEKPIRLKAKFKSKS